MSMSKRKFLVPKLSQAHVFFLNDTIPIGIQYLGAVVLHKTISYTPHLERITIL